MASDPCRSSATDASGPDADNVIPFPGVVIGPHGARTRARRDWLFGRWAAECLGLEAASARRYARDVASMDGPPGVPIRRVMMDFEIAGVDISCDELLDRVEEFHVQADIWARCTRRMME